ncbi:MAG: 50S ribosomal protein L4 [Deltaproteobacteria bacterium]|nr:50S ribosomal protein L4 [Deltaproteobacteria bacterium]MBW2422261.1 50S ribosomal protein L4 [Deltaproteobacteria bacterium]
MDIVTTENQKAGSVELSPVVFEATVKPHLFQAEVRRQLALRRAGTHSSKNRSRVSGGGAKPYRQKGTGRARQGTTRAPQWAGGGVAFGPVPRGHEHKLNKKTRRAALRSALSARLAESAITVVDALELAEFKTRRVMELLDGLGLAGESVLIVISEPSATIEASARNIPKVSVLRAAGLNVYDVLRHSKLLFTKAAVEAVEVRLGEGDSGDGKEETA